MPRRDSEYARALKGKKPRETPDTQVSFPIADGEKAQPPDYLTDEALIHWFRMVDILNSAKLFQLPTRDKLGRYCQACADYEDIQTARKKLGARRHILTKTNYHQQEYWSKRLKDYDHIMKDFEMEYGLTPAAATKVRHPAKLEDHPAKGLKDFLAAKPVIQD